jgi:hypothetical protein
VVIVHAGRKAAERKLEGRPGELVLAVASLIRVGEREGLGRGGVADAAIREMKAIAAGEERIAQKSPVRP